MDSLVATNYGWGAAAGVTAELTSNNTSYVVDDGLCAFDDIAGQSTGIGTDQFTYHYTGIPGEPDFNLELSDRYGRTWGRQVDLDPPSGITWTPWLILAGDNYLTIGWGLSHAPDLRGYNVYRRQGTTGDFHLANALLVDTSATFRDEGLSPYTVYQYRVSAVDFSGNESNPSAVLQAMTTPTYQPGWSVHAASGHEQRTSGVCGNIIGDDKLEVVAVMGDSIYAWYSNGQRVQGWPKGLGIIPSCAPALADLNGDGYDEVVLGVSDGQGLFAWKGDGSNVPGWPANVPFTGSVAVADLDQDGSLEVIGATADHYLNIWSASGTLARRWRILDDENFECTVHGSPAVADLDANSTGAKDLEIVVIAKAAPNTPDPDKPSVLAYRNDGTRMWAHGILDAARTWGADCNSPVIGDLDGNGEVEVVAAVSGSDADDIHVLSHDGVFLDDLADIDFRGTWGCPALGDVTGDGQPEIVITAGGIDPSTRTSHTCLAAWRFVGGQCVLVSMLDEVGAGSFRTGPGVLDINGDGQMEVVTGYWHSVLWNDRLRAFRLAGGQFQEMLTDGFPIYGVDFPYQELVATDLDIDGDLELLAFMCEQGVVHAWDFPVPYDRRKVEWGSFHGDVRHTGLYAQPIWGNVAHDMYWWGRYKLCGNLTLTDYDLTVQRGTWVQARRRLSTVTAIMVNSGTFAATGTRAARTYFEAELTGDAWDGIRVNNGSASVTGCNIADATEGLAATECASLQVSGDTFTNCQIGAITSLYTGATSVEGCYFTGSGIHDIFAGSTVPSSCVVADNMFYNGGDYGIWVESSVTPDIAGNTLWNVKPTSQYGIKYCQAATTPQLRGSIRRNTIGGYGQGGILCEGSSPRIYSRNDIELNSAFGLSCLDGSFPAVESSTITNHYVGVLAANGSYPDLGTVQGSTGYNSIYFDLNYHVVNANDPPALTIMAQNNWWGEDPPNVTKFYGDVTYFPWLAGPPGDGVQEKSVTPAFPLALGLGRPNPFSAATRIMLSNPRQQRLVVSIYDVAGRHVQTLLNAEAPPGRSWLSWNGHDAKGRKVGSGVYFCRLAAGNDKKVSRVVYVRGK